MQTFLPHKDFYMSAAALDNKRLGKQRVETLQIMSVLTGLRLISTKVVKTGEVKTVMDDSGEMVEDPAEKVIQLDRGEWTTEPLTKKGWANHPAVKMWRGHEYFLWLYQQAVCRVWANRGFKDTCEQKTMFLYTEWRKTNLAVAGPPPWLGREDVHRSHQSNLVRKLPEHYGLLYPDVPDDLEYVWPVE